MTNSERKLRRKKARGADARTAGRYAGAAPGEATTGHQEMARRIAVVLGMAVKGVGAYPEGSKEWLRCASIIETIQEAILHSSVEVTARTLLLDSIELAALFCAMSDDERAWFRSRYFDTTQRVNIGPEAINFGVAFGASFGFIERCRAWPWDEPCAFVTFDFSKRAPAYAASVRTPEAQEALRTCIEVWRSRGRPAKDAAGKLGKWLAAHLLMGAVGLEGATAETLEAEWKTRRLREPENEPEALMKKERLATSVLSRGFASYPMRYAAVPRSPSVRSRASNPHGRRSQPRRNGRSEAAWPVPRPSRPSAGKAPHSPRQRSAYPRRARNTQQHLTAGGRVKPKERAPHRERHAPTKARRTRQGSQSTNSPKATMLRAARPRKGAAA